MTRRGGAGDVLVRLVAHPRASPRGLLQGEPRTARCLQPRSPARSPTSRNGHVTVTQRLRTGHAAAAQRPHNCKLPAARSPCLRSRSSRSSQAHRSPPTPRHPARAPSTLSTASWQCRSDLRPQRPAPAAPAARAHRVCAQSSSGGGRCRHALPPGLRPARPVSTPPPRAAVAAAALRVLRVASPAAAAAGCHGPRPGCEGAGRRPPPQSPTLKPSHEAAPEATSPARLWASCATSTLTRRCTLSARTARRLAARRRSPSAPSQAWTRSSSTSPSKAFSPRWPARSPRPPVLIGHVSSLFPY